MNRSPSDEPSTPPQVPVSASPIRRWRRVLRSALRPAPYVLTATVVGTYALFAYEPEVDSSGLVTAAEPAVPFPKPQRGKEIHEAFVEAKRHEVPVLAGPPRTVLGTLEKIEPRHPFGTIQVRAVVTGGLIQDVQIAQFEPYSSRADQIAAYSIPSLIVQTVTRNTTQVDNVSSATFTSDAYERSLQAAIDELRT